MRDLRPWQGRSRIGGKSRLLEPRVGGGRGGRARNEVQRTVWLTGQVGG